MTAEDGNAKESERKNDDSRLVSNQKKNNGKNGNGKRVADILDQNTVEPELESGSGYTYGDETDSNQPDESDGSSHEKDDKKKAIHKSDFHLTAEDLNVLNTKEGLIELLRSKDIRIKDVVNTLKYEKQMIGLQVELVKLQRWVTDNGKRVAILFEGRDAAGKGGAIRRFTEHMNPRAMRVVALPKPSLEEQGQWYFQRYSKHLPNEGELVFFDRSWYNRAVVEPVNKFCTEAEYLRFMQQVPEWEHMLYEDGLVIIKFWFSISKEEQERRFVMRRHDPLKQWKLSPIDQKAQALWNDYTHYKEEMLSKTHTSFSPWIIVKANNKKPARLESIRYLLDHIPYAGKEHSKIRIAPDPNVVTRFHRNANKLD